MIRGRAILCAVLLLITYTVSAIAEPGDRYLNVKGRVLDILFPLDVTPKPYFSKMILRYGDSDTQFTVVVYPGARTELIRYGIANSGAGLTQFISRMIAEKPGIDAREIAAALKINVTHFHISSSALGRAVNDLRSIQISPMLPSRTAIDDYSEYEFWYDTWQESVHYTITSPFDRSPVGQLGRWMLNFRTSLNKIVGDDRGLQ